MAYKVIILYRLYMPSYFLGTFTEYHVIVRKKVKNNLVIFFIGKSEQAFYTCKYIFKI